MLQKTVFLVLHPRQHVEAVYNQKRVFNVQNLHWRQYLNISSRMQVHGPTDVLAPEHCRAKACGFLLQGLVKEKDTLYLQPIPDKTIQCQDVP